jgi:hypothetical protein
MSISSYPGGFSNGVSIKNIPIEVAYPAKVFWVSNNSTNVPAGVVAGDDTNGKGTYNQPYATIDKAINMCAAGRGDKIFVKAGHAETVDAATDIVPDVDAVSIIGLGEGEDRPIITFATAAAAAIPITGDSVSIENMIFKCNIASQNHMLDIAALDVLIKDCDFREGTQTGLSFITCDTADNDSHRLRIDNCKFYAPTAGNYDQAISLAKDFIGVRIANCEIYGDFDNAGIDVPAGGNAQIDLQISNCKAINLLTGQHAIQINGTGNTGMIIDCMLGGDTIGTICDSGGLEMYNVYEHDGTDQTNAVLVGGAVASATLVDDTNNILGFDDNNNAFASTNVVENADGSIIERLEFIQAGIPRSVLNSAVDLTAGDVVDVFTVSGGPVLVTMLAVEITTAASANASLLHFEADPTVGASNTPISKAACAPDLASAAVGDWFAVTGDSAVVAVKYANGTALPDSATSSLGVVVPAGGIDMKLSTGDLTTGIANVYIQYIPLAPGASVA